MKTFQKIRNTVVSHLKEFKEKESFAQNLAITFSAHAVAQVIGIALTPFIARIYGPQAYGVFALFIAIVNNLSPLSTLQFPSGYVAAGSRDELDRLIKITFTVLFVGTSLLFFITALWGTSLTAFFEIEELNLYLFWIPVYFLLMGIDHLLLGWNIREKEFKRGAAAKLFSTFVSKGVTILYGVFVFPNAQGILIGNLLTYPFESFVKISTTIRNDFNKVFHRSSWSQLGATFSKFKGYALYVTPGLFITNFSSQLPVYCFSIVFNENIVGLFALANSIVTMPLSLITNSSTTVFLQKAAETMQHSIENLRTLVLSLYKKLFWIGVLGMTTLALISEWIFRLIFGEVWMLSGIFASFLCMGAILSITSNPLNVLFRLMHYEKINFIINILFLGIRFFGIWLGLHFDSPQISIIGFSIASLLHSATLLLAIFRFMEIPIKTLLRDFVIITIIFTVIIVING